MAVAEQAAPAQTPLSPQRMQLGAASLLGAALVMFSICFVLGGLPTLWDYVGISDALNEFLSGTLLLLVMIGTATGLFFLLRGLDRSSAQPGLRAGVFFGGIALYIVLGLVTKLGVLLEPAQGEELNVVALGFTGVVLLGLLAGAYWLFSRPGFGQFLIRMEDQGWFHAIGYKSNQGVRVRRGTILALLTVVLCGIYTLSAHRALGSSRLDANDWIWDLPFTASADGTTSLYVPLIHKVHIAMPILLAIAGVWVSWRVVNWPAFADFLIATEAEMNKVSWTTRRRLVQDTIVVLVTVFLFTAFLFVVDIIWIKVLTNPWIGVLQVDVREAFQKQQEKTQW